MTTQDGKEAAIAGLRMYRDELLTEIERFRADLATVDRSIELLMATSEGRKPVAVVNRSGRLQTGPQEVVTQFLRHHAGMFYKPTVLAKLLLDDSYRPSNLKTWATQVTTCCKRAVEKGLAERQEVDGKMVYGLKPTSGLPTRQAGETALRTR